MIDTPVCGHDCPLCAEPPHLANPTERLVKAALFFADEVDRLDDDGDPEQVADVYSSANARHHLYRVVRESNATALSALDAQIVEQALVVDEDYDDPKEAMNPNEELIRRVHARKVALAPKTRSAEEVLEETQRRFVERYVSTDGFAAVNHSQLARWNAEALRGAGLLKEDQ